MHAHPMPAISLGLIVRVGTLYDLYHWQADDGERRALVGFDAGGTSHGHLQGPPAALRELAAALIAAAGPGRHRRPGPFAGGGGGELMWDDSPDCPACATGWHARCCWPELADDGDGELLERCCDGLLIARRRRPLWSQGVR